MPRMTSPPAKPLAVALVEDDPGMRERLAAAIRHSPGLALRYEGASAHECVQWLGAHPVDVLLVDLGLPDGSGIDVIHAARRLQPACDVMVVTVFADEANMVQAFAAGARGYLIKDGTEQDVARHVRDLGAGGSPMSPMIARRLLKDWTERTAPPREAAARPDPLTPREEQVLASIARGFTYDEIAQQLGVSSTTVRTHVRGIYVKLDVHSKTEAVFEARALGLLR